MSIIPNSWTHRIILTILLLLVGFVLVPWLLIIVGVLPYSHGSRVGIVNKFSEERGWLIKSAEGSLFMAGEAAGMAGNSWEFSVKNPEIKKKVREALDSQQRVRLEYQEWTIVYWLTDTKYHIVNVVPLGPKPR